MHTVHPLALQVPFAASTPTIFAVKECLLNEAAVLSGMHNNALNFEIEHFYKQSLRIVLTGASGLVGLHFIDALYRLRVNADVVLYVRSEKNLIDNIGKWNLQHLLPLISGASTTLLDTSTSQIPTLSRKYTAPEPPDQDHSLRLWVVIDPHAQALGTPVMKKIFSTSTHVIHSAARMHGLSKLGGLWDNVVFTQQLRAALLSLDNPPELIHISTLSVYASALIGPDPLTKTHHFPWIYPIANPAPLPMDPNYYLIGGYAQSKYLCEELLFDVPGSKTIRPTLIYPPKGPLAKEDFLYQTQRALLYLKMLPEGYLKGAFNSLYASTIGEALYRIIRPGEAHTRTQNLHQENTPSRIYHLAASSHAYLTDFLSSECTIVSKKEFALQLASLYPTERTIQTLISQAFLGPMHTQPLHVFNLNLAQSEAFGTWNSTLPLSVSSQYPSLGSDMLR